MGPRHPARQREAEPWFDPDGFLLHDDAAAASPASAGRRSTPTTDPPLGEIYVIAVDPDWHGTGLGRRLTLAGLDYLAGKGLTIGMLYVDAANTPAVKLYVELGFAINHLDQAYVGDVGSGSS